MRLTLTQNINLQHEAPAPVTVNVRFDWRDGDPEAVQQMATSIFTYCQQMTNGKRR